MVDLQFMKLPLSGDFSVFKLLFGMACAMAAISTVFACILVGTPMVPVLLLWCASKEYRVGGKGPMIFLAPLIGWIPTYLLIVGFVTPNPTFCLVQFPLVLAFGAVVFRDSIANLLGLNKQRKVQKQQYVQLPLHSYGSNL